MPQEILDPADTNGAAGAMSVPLLPARIRKFGYVPAVDVLAPGDLILYGGTGTVGQWIIAAQSKAGFAQEDARWTHAAVYLDDGFLVEAVVKGGVVQRSIYDNVCDRPMRFRRIPDLTETDRYRIALRALSRLGRSYSTFQIPSLGRRLLKGLWNASPGLDQKGIVICSQVYHDAIVEITRTYLHACPVDAPVTPAHLSCSRSLMDIKVGWRSVL
jgi:hypothetical protein